MKKFKEILEQHREKGRFRPVKPQNVQNVVLGSPRPSSDSANVKLKEDLRKWFSKTDPAGDWKRINSKGEVVGPCARKPGEPKPKCMSRAKRESLTQKERAAAVRAKRKYDPNPERKGEPINVSNFGKGKISENMENLDEKNVPTNPELWSRAKSLARSKFDVYPSAYANGWASKWYKGKGGSWKSVSEETQKENSLLEKWSQKHVSEETLSEAPPNTADAMKRFKAGKAGFTDKAHLKAKGLIARADGTKRKSVDEEKKDQYDEGEYDQEGDMAKSDLRSIMANAKRVHDMLEDSDNLPEWVQSKITKAEDYMSTVSNYMESEMSEEVKTVTVKHKTSGKELVVSPEKAKQLKPQGYHPVKEGVDAIGLVKQKTSLTPAAKTLAPATRVAEQSKPPFDGPYTTIKKVVTDKSGAKHSPMSRARDLARMAMKKQSEKMKQPVKESLDESRRMEIVREAMKVAKNKKEMMAADDKYQSDPVLSSQITKT